MFGAIQICYNSTLHITHPDFECHIDLAPNYDSRGVVKLFNAAYLCDEDTWMGKNIIKVPLINIVTNMKERKKSHHNLLVKTTVTTHFSKTM